jgi:hypothetical protein
MNPSEALRNFNAFQQGDGSKQLHFEQKITRALLAAGGAASTVATNEHRKLRDEFGLNWFNTNHPNCPLAIESRKLREPVDLAALVRGDGRKTAHYRMHQELKQNWPDRPVGLVWDTHGDGISDLILHQDSHLLYPEAFMVRFYTDEEQTYFIQPFKAFLLRLSQVWQPYSN